MISILRGFVKSIPTLILSFALAVAVWVSAINASDPVQQKQFPRPIPIEVVGQDASLVISNDIPTQATVTLSAPKSVWDRMVNEKNPVRVWISLSGLGPGSHTVKVQVQPLSLQPVKTVSAAPGTITVTLEKLETKTFPVQLVRRGEPAVGFQVDPAKLSQDQVTISGPVSKVEKVKSARVALDVTNASDNINQTIKVAALDANDAIVENLTVTPEQVTVTQPISQRGGYRNVVVKVASSGQVASGYRLTNISVFPPNVTVFASDPSLIDKLPGYVETSPLDLNGQKDDIDIRLPLNLPNGVEVVGDATVSVQVGVAAIEGSVTLSTLKVGVAGLSESDVAHISPETVDVIISGPIPLLDKLTEEDVQVYLDLNGVGPGTYQFAPKVTVSIPELQVESILPGSIEVVVQGKGTITPTPSVTGTPTPTPTPGR